MANAKQAQNTAVLRPAKINGLEKDLIQMTASVPPMTRLVGAQRFLHQTLRNGARHSRKTRVYSHNPAERIGKNKHIAGRKTPDISGSILDGRGVPCRHQCFEAWQIR